MDQFATENGWNVNFDNTLQAMFRGKSSGVTSREQFVTSLAETFLTKVNLLDPGIFYTPLGGLKISPVERWKNPDSV